MSRSDADRFADLLDSLESGDLAPSANSRLGRTRLSGSPPLAQQLSIAAALRSIEFDLEPSELTRARQRQRLVAMAAVRTANLPSQDTVSSADEVVGRASSLTRTASNLREGLLGDRRGTRGGRHRVVGRRATAGIAAFSLVVATVGVLGLVAQNSLPGDPLYSFKRGTEQAQLAFSEGQREEGTELLTFATIRLTEIAALLDEPASLDAVGGGVIAAAADADPELLIETMATMDEQTVDGTNALTNTAVDEDSVPTLQFVAEWGIIQFETLDALAARMPDAAQERAEESKDLLQRVVMRLEDLAETLVCDCLAEEDTQDDELGPMPCPTCVEVVEPDGDSTTSSGTPEGPVATTPDAGTGPEDEESTAPPVPTTAPPPPPATTTPPPTTTEPPPPTTPPDTSTSESSPPITPPVDPPVDLPEGSPCTFLGALGIPIPGIIVDGVCVPLGG